MQLFRLVRPTDGVPITRTGSNGPGRPTGSPSAPSCHDSNRQGGTAMRGGLRPRIAQGASIRCPLQANLVRSQISPSPAVNRTPTLDQRLLQLLGPTVPAARAGRAFVALGIDPAAQAVARGEDRKG